MTEPAGPLRGVRVLDLSWGVAGPVGVLLLAELGADVIKVEPPGGDPFRRQPGYHVWNRSRRSVVLDLKADEGREVFLRLCEDADVLVETFSPGTMDRLGLSYADVSPRFPRLVFCSVPAYPPGHRFADRPGWDATVQARSGMQSEQPGWRPGPIYLHFPAPSMAACFLLATGVLSALIHREATGRGQHVQTSLYQGVLAYTTQIWQEHERAPAGFHSTMAKTYPPGIHQTSLFECAGGEWIHAATMNGLTPTRTPEEILGLDPVDPRALYADPELRARHEARLRAAYLQRRREELIEEFHEAGLGAEAVGPMAEVFSHAPVRGERDGGNRRGPRARAHHTGWGTGRVARHTGGDPGRSAPRRCTQPRGVGGSELFRGRDRPSARRGDRGGRVVGPLSGVVVLDLGQYLAGPFGPMVLADLGAEVIKVEPVRGDGMRMAGMPFVGCQRGKLDIAVDVKAPEGLEAVMRLAEIADVVHHNMTKGTAARLGIDYESLKARNPDLVHCNTYAYGAEGPLSEFGGLDPLYQAACGLEFEAGPVAGGNPPLYLRFGMTDTANAMVSAVGVLAALYHQRRTGEGQDLWTSLLNGAAVFGSDVFLVDGQPGPVRPGLDSNQMGVSPCCRLYETQEGWVQVAAFASGQWAQLCRLVGRPDLERYETFEERVAARVEIESALEPIFLTRTAVAWFHDLAEAGVDAEVSVDTNDGEVVLHDADNERLGLVAEYPHPILGQLRQFGTLIDFSESPTGPYGPPPLVGEHTRRIMERLGYSSQEIEDLLTRGIVYEPTEDYRWTL